MSQSEQLISISPKFQQFCPDSLQLVKLPEMISSWNLLFWQEMMHVMALPKAQKARLLPAAFGMDLEEILLFEMATSAVDYLMNFQMI